MSKRVTITHNKDGSRTKRTTYSHKNVLGTRKTETFVERIPATKKGCYVATAVYGSYDCPQVWVLRRFRDYYLSERMTGRIFIKLYYAISPAFVRLFGNTAFFTKLVRRRLDTFVSLLKRKGFSEDPYKD